MTNTENPEVETISTPEAIEKGKSMAIVAYITYIGLIIAFVSINDKKNTYISYHIRQSLGLCLTSIALMIINVLPILGWIVSFLGGIFILVLWIIGLVNAIGGKEKPVPVLGKLFVDWFKNV